MILVKKAKLHNNLNLLLQEALPEKLKGIELCLVEEKKVTLIAENSSLAFRAKKQQKILLDIIKKIEGLSKTRSISIAIDKNNY